MFLQDLRFLFLRCNMRQWPALFQPPSSWSTTKEIEVTKDINKMWRQRHRHCLIVDSSKVLIQIYLISLDIQLQLLRRYRKLQPKHPDRFYLKRLSAGWIGFEKWQASAEHGPWHRCLRALPAVTLIPLSRRTLLCDEGRGCFKVAKRLGGLSKPGKNTSSLGRSWYCKVSTCFNKRLHLPAPPKGCFLVFLMMFKSSKNLQTPCWGCWYMTTSSFWDRHRRTKRNLPGPASPPLQRWPLGHWRLDASRSEWLGRKRGWVGWYCMNGYILWYFIF